MFNIKQRNLFPTDLFFTNIFDEKENEIYKQELIKIANTEEGKVRSNRGGFQSDTMLWNNEVFKPLLEKSTAVIQSIIADYSQNRPEFVIRSMWGNVNPKGGYNLTHVHPSGWMSCVYYVNVPENSSGITFEDPRPAKIMDFQQSCLRDDNYFTHQPTTGDLVIFPSWLPHFVNPNPTDDLRMSISFNVELVV